MTQAAAYADAGYAGGKNGASRLALSAPVKARVTELLDRMAPGSPANIALIVDDLMRLARKSEDTNTPAGLTGARAALLAAAKLSPLVPRVYDPEDVYPPELDNETWMRTYSPGYLGNGRWADGHISTCLEDLGE
jgi:hypothetical protein